MSALAHRSRPALAFQSVSRSHPGARRTLNEDRVLDRAGLGLWAVADGMGGHRAGDAAAAKLVEALDQVEHAASGYAWLAEVTRRVDTVNAELFGDGEAAGSPSGATLVALLVHEGHYACLWAGDSRAYRLRDGVLTALTRDHSVVQQLVDEGALPASERNRHPRAHVITRAVGAGARLDLDKTFAQIAEGDVFLLCSDGLTGCVDDEEISQALRDAALPDAADHLLATALARHAPDNVSLILVRAETTAG